jgi:hypothetical protein
MKKHPNIYVPSKGNPNYFSLRYDRDHTWYKKQFEGATVSQVTIDKSTSYFRIDSVPKRIYDYDENTEIIIILRDPIERIYSHYCMLAKDGKKSRNIKKEIKDSKNLLKEGKYYTRISRFKEYFDLNKIHIFHFGCLKESPKLYWRKILQTLKVDDSVVPAIVEKKHHTRGGMPRFRNFYSKLVEINRFISNHSEIYERTFEWLSVNGFVKPIRKLLGDKRFPELDEELKTWLRKYYKNDVRNLRKLLGKKSPTWTKKYIGLQ